MCILIDKNIESWYVTLTSMKGYFGKLLAKYDNDDSYDDDYDDTSPW